MRTSRGVAKGVTITGCLCLLSGLWLACTEKAAANTDKSSSQSSCLSNTKLHQEAFYVGAHGQVSNVGRTTEGPVCITVYFNAISTDFAVGSATTYSNGPEPSSVILTGPVSAESAHQIQTNRAETEEDPYVAMKNEADTLQKRTQKAAKAWETLEGLSAQVDSLLLRRDVDDIPKAIANGYDTFKKSMGGSIDDVLDIQNNFLATDLASGSCPATPPISPQPDSLLQRVLAYKEEQWMKLDAGKQSLVQTLLLDTQSMACGEHRLSQMTTQLLSIQAFKDRLQLIGFDLSGTKSDSSSSNPQQSNGTKSDSSSSNPQPDPTLLAHFMYSEEAPCGNIFNQSSSTVYSATVFDQSDYLDGKSKDATGHPINNLVTITCASPIVISVGVEFSTIDDIEYAIKKSKDISSGSTGTTSASQFQQIVESEVHPLPVALAHARLWDWSNHKYGAYFTAGASGNIQSQSAGGSSAEFLLGGSLAFFRTVFISCGLHIGTRATLGGGFKPGDNVPSDITDISQVPINKSYHPGFGFAVTFTKP